MVAFSERTASMLKVGMNKERATRAPHQRMKNTLHCWVLYDPVLWCPGSCRHL